MSFTNGSSRLFVPPTIFFDADGGGSAGSGGGSGAAGGTPESGASGASQQTSTGAGSPTQQNTDQLTAQLTALAGDFAAYKKSSNSELASARKKLAQLLKGAGVGDGDQEQDSDPEKSGDKSGELQASILTLTQATQQKDQQISQLVTQIQTMQKQLAVERHARIMGFLHEEDVFRLVDPGTLVIDEKTGAITGTEEALKQLIVKYPALVGKKTGQAPPDDNGDRKTKTGETSQDREQRLRQRFNIH